MAIRTITPLSQMLDKYTVPDNNIFKRKILIEKTQIDYIQLLSESLEKERQKLVEMERELLERQRMAIENVAYIRELLERQRMAIENVAYISMGKIMADLKILNP